MEEGTLHMDEKISEKNTDDKDRPNRPNLGQFWP